MPVVLINVYLIIGLGILLSLYLGQWLEKFQIIWLMAALIMGLMVSGNDALQQILSDTTVAFIAQTGMYLLLFIVGFDLDITALRRQSKMVLRSAAIIILLEALVTSSLIHWLLGYEWMISIVVALSFATVGEAILVPILDRHRAINTKVGQMIIEIGTADDLIEVITLIMVIFWWNQSGRDYQINLLFIGSLMALLLFLTLKVRSRISHSKFWTEDLVMGTSMGWLLLWIGLGSGVELAPIAALLAGASLRAIMPHRLIKTADKSIRLFAYGLFVPVFFLWVGASVNLSSLIKSTWLVLLMVTVTTVIKILGTYLSTYKRLNRQQALLVGVGLSVRFSTSIVIVRILWDHQLIGQELYSLIIASSVVAELLIPILFNYLLHQARVQHKPI